MSSNNIDVSNIVKRYQIFDKPSDRLKQFILPKILKIFLGKNKSYYREFTALDNISFSVNRKETLGVLGVNGSGKSTLLQLLAGTLSQTSGDIIIKGKIGCILELGSGFNPEFTGIENIYLNLQILYLQMHDLPQEQLVSN